MNRAMRAAVGLVAALLAGCADSGPMTDQQACEKQANDDPVVKLMIMKGAGTTHYMIEHQDELKAARQDAVLNCLRARGLVAPGGVERVKKPI